MSYSGVQTHILIVKPTQNVHCQIVMWCLHTAIWSCVSDCVTPWVSIVGVSKFRNAFLHQRNIPPIIVPVPDSPMAKWAPQAFSLILASTSSGRWISILMLLIIFYILHFLCFWLLIMVILSLNNVQYHLVINRNNLSKHLGQWVLTGKTNKAVQHNGRCLCWRKCCQHEQTTTISSHNYIKLYDL